MKWLLSRTGKYLGLRGKLLLPLTTAVLLIVGFIVFLSLDTLSHTINDGYMGRAEGIIKSLYADIFTPDLSMTHLQAEIDNYVELDPYVYKIAVYAPMGNGFQRIMSTDRQGIGEKANDGDIEPFRTGRMLFDERKENNRSIAEVVGPIYHNGQVVATVGVYMDLFARDTALEEQRRWFIGIGIVGMILLQGMLYLAIDRLLLRRIFELAEITEFVSKGQYAIKAKIHEEDELGNLAVSVNRMTTSIVEQSEQLQHQLHQLERAYKEIAAMHAVSEKVSRTLDLSQALNDSLDAILQNMSFESGAVYLLEENSADMVLSVHRGFPMDFLEQNGRVAYNEILQSNSNGHSRNGGIAIIDEVLVRYRQNESGWGFFASAPMESKGKLVGMLLVGNRERRKTDPQDISLLNAIASQLGVAIDNVRLYHQTQRSLSMQALLVQEMNHRVKNNLQTIADLLSLQLHRHEASADEALMESINRVKSLAAVHDLLSYQGQSQISIKDVAQKVGETIVPRRLVSKIHLEVRGTQAMLPLKEATSLALALNELVTNAVKHAFVDCESGFIWITIFDTTRALVVQVSDNGHGLPPTFDVKSSSRLGLQIVTSLVTRDLGGTIVISSDNGTTATITIPKKEADIGMVLASERSED